MMQKIRVNMVSESDITVQGHGVHTAYEEISSALEKRQDVTVIRGDFGKRSDVDIVHFHTIGSHTWRKLFQPKVKKVVTAHVIPASFVGSIILAKYWSFLARWYMSWFYNKADKVLAVSQTVANVLHDELKVPLSKIEVAYNTIDMGRYKPTANSKQEARKALNFDQNNFIVIGNGQVQPRKRLDVFVKMAQAMPDATFVWVGGIPFKQLGADYISMQKIIDSVPKNLIVTGVVPHKKVALYLAAADIFCLPAEQENHPVCVLEAASAGLPIVLRDLPEYNDTFGSDAIRCQDDTFIAAIKKLRSDSKFYRDQQQKTQAIARRFDSTKAAEDLVKLYRQLI